MSFNIGDRVRYCRDTINPHGGFTGIIIDVITDNVRGNQMRVCWDGISHWTDGRVRSYLSAERDLVEIT
jgi:hypothetical protein